MGRIGAGEAVTLLFGLAGPLIHLAIGVALVVWGRRATEAGRRFGRPGLYAAVSALAVVVLAVVLSVLGAFGALGAAAAGGADAGTRATTLAQGIAEAMNAVALGVVVSLGLYLVSFVLLLLSRRSAT